MRNVLRVVRTLASASAAAVALALTVCAACFAGCGTGAPATLAPDPAVVNTMANPRPFDIGVRVECMGPSAQTAMLGALCMYGSNDANWTSRLAHFDYAVGPAGMPTILIYAWVPDPTSTSNQNRQVQYAVFLDRMPSAMPLDDWRTSERLTGTVSTLYASHVACTGGTFTAIGEFRWRDVTIRVTWGATQPC